MSIIIVLCGIIILAMALISLFKVLSNIPFNEIKGSEWFKQSPHIKLPNFAKPLAWGAAGFVLLIAGFVVDAEQAPKEQAQMSKPIQMDIAADNLSGCLKLIKQALSRPSSYKSGWIPAEAKNMGDGVTVLVINFSAENSFGAETAMLGFCSIQPDGELKLMSIKER